jgi:hypothetical protein
MRTFILHGDTQAKALEAYLKANRAACAAAGKPLEVIVCKHKEKRRSVQNRLYWAILRDISEQAMLGGRQFSDECWHEHFKRLFVGVVDLPDGRQMGESTTRLSVTEFAEYVSNVQAFAVGELGVIFSDTEQ